MEIEHKAESVVYDALAEWFDIVEVLAGIGVVFGRILSLVVVWIDKEAHPHGVHALVVQPWQQVVDSRSFLGLVLGTRCLIFGQE